MPDIAAFIAVAVIVTHLAVLFWPRKPLNVPTDETGMPIPWRNEDEARKDVACVWPGEVAKADGIAAAGKKA